MSEFDPRRHRDRARDLAAVQFEMPDPELDVEKIRVGFVDADTFAPESCRCWKG